MRPARIGFYEGGIARKGWVGVVGAQDHPFSELAGDRIGNAGLGRIRISFLAFARCFDHAFDRRDVGGRGRRRRRDCEGAGNRAREGFECGAAFEQRAMQADIGLRERREARAVCGWTLLRERRGGRNWGCRRRARFPELDRWPRPR